MGQLALPLPTPSREVLDAQCHEVGRHVCDDAYLWCTAFGELDWLVGFLQALDNGWAWHEATWQVTLWQRWLEA